MKTLVLIPGSCAVTGISSWYLTKTISEGEFISLLANNHVTEAKLYAQLQDLISNKKYQSALEILSAIEDGAKIAVDVEVQSIEENIITRYLYGSSIEEPNEFLKNAPNQQRNTVELIPFNGHALPPTWRASNEQKAEAPSIRYRF